MRLARLAALAALFLIGMADSNLSASAAFVLDSKPQRVSAAGAEHDGEARASVRFSHKLVIFDRVVASVEEYEFAKVPDAEELTIPFDEERRSVLFHCKGFRDDGHLKDCEFQATRDLEPFARQLVSGLAVDPAYVRSFTDPVVDVYVNARILRSDARGADARCSPPNCITVALAPRPPRRNESVAVVDSTIFYRSTEVETEDFEFNHVPDAAELGIPFRAGKFGLVFLECERLKPDGRLDSCEVEVSPDDVGYEAVGQKLARELTVEPAYARSLTRPIRFVSVQARVSNSDIPARSGPCLPPSCIPIPAPPPPPPAQVLDDPELEAWYDAWQARWRAAAQLGADRLGDARRAASDAGLSAPGTAPWIAARKAAFAYLESRKRQRELIRELMRFRSDKFRTASAADLKRLAEIERGKLATLDSTEKNTSRLLFSLIEANWLAVTRRAESVGAETETR